MRTIRFIKLVNLYLLVLSAFSSALSLFTRQPQMLTEVLENVPMLNSLNDDILLEICAAARQLSNATEHKELHDSDHRLPLLEKLSEVRAGARSPFSVFGSKEQAMSPLKALSLTNRRIRDLAAPELFRSIKIGEDWDWEKALRALDSIARCEAVGKYTKSFLIDLYIGDTWFESIREDATHRGPKPPQRFPFKLLQILTSLKKVEKLTLIIPGYHTEAFRISFENANTTFPSVRTLVLGPHMDWMIALCPNVETISSHNWRWLHSNVDGDYRQRHSKDLIRSAGQAKNLKHFEMKGWWTLEQLETVYHAMPWIKSLALPGGQYGDGIETLLPTLGRFKNLTSLVIADAHALGVGFDPPGCGNVYFGPGGEEFRRQVQEESLQAEESVARMVFERLPQLEELWIGDDSKANVTRTVSGAIGEISWAYDAHEKPYKGY